jgi:hypothetical protein
MMKERTRIQQRLVSMRAIQAIYMPVVPDLLASHLAVSATQQVEMQPLFLPHALSVDQLDKCAVGLADLEARLRDGQLRDALESLRLHLHIKTRLVTAKALHARHQAANTRARQKINDNEVKIVTAAEKYRLARCAKYALCGPGAWEQDWRELKREDVRCMQDDDPRMGARSSEGRCAVSWIWISAARDVVDENAAAGELNDSEYISISYCTYADSSRDVRIEFLKARARALRFNEEVTLVMEEQRRTLSTLEFRAVEWDRLKSESTQGSAHDPVLARGMFAYASRQASMYRRLRAKFQTLWAQGYAPEPVDGAAEAEPETILHHIVVEDESDSDSDVE